MNATHSKDLLAKTMQVLLKTPAQERTQFARKHLSAKYHHVLNVFDSIQQTYLPRTILFLAPKANPRVLHFAHAARLAGWHPLLVYSEVFGTRSAGHFEFAVQIPPEDFVQFILISWCFPGPIIHGFFANGSEGRVFTATKNTRFVLDIFDTCSTTITASTEARRTERECLATADGITHRDLRISRLRRLYGYGLAQQNGLFPDPLTTSHQAVASRAQTTEIHVAFVGEAKAGDQSLFRCARLLCEKEIHVHAFLDRARSDGDELARYEHLRKTSTCFHIEELTYDATLEEKLAQYDFGLAAAEREIFGEPWTSCTVDDYTGKNIQGVNTYIQANLGIITSPSLQFQNFYLRKSAAFMVFASEAFLENPRSTLAAALAERNARTSSSSTSMTVEETAPRLGRFYERVLSNPSSTKPVHLRPVRPTFDIEERCRSIQTRPSAPPPQPPTPGTFYVITAYAANHLRTQKPVDPRFTDTHGRTIFYLVDENTAVANSLPGPVITEKSLDPRLWQAGREHLAEWSFLLNEYQTPFVRYPFYIISSRFYEKNQRLGTTSLNAVAELLFNGLARYGWSYLPSYDRPPGFVDLAGYARGTSLGIKKSGTELVKSLLGVDPVFDARWFSDFFCNYIGFHSREHLVRYVEFYLPLLRFFLDEAWQLRRPVGEYVRSLAVYHKEKPLTFLIEMASHLFFLKNQVPFFGVHPEGLFEVREHATTIEHIHDLDASSEALEAWGSQLLGVSQFELGEALLERVIKRTPTRSTAYASIAHHRMRRGDFPGARTVLQQGLPRNPCLQAKLSEVEARATSNSAVPAL